MSTFVSNDVASGATIFASDHNEMGARIAAVVNGGLDDSNIAPGAAINGSKMANNTLDIGAKASAFNGWVLAVGSWTYSSYDSTNKTGVFTVPSDATTVYSPGMHLRFSQPTDGTKYGIITKVATTTLTVYLGTDYDLDNESISSVYFSVVKAPLGFPLDPAKWTVEVSSSSDRSTTSTTYVSLTDSISVPIGSFKVSLLAALAAVVATTNIRQVRVALSSSTTAVSDNELVGYCQGVGVAGTVGASISVQKNITVASATTYTMIGLSGASTTMQVLGSSATPTILRAVCAYL